MSPSLPNAQRTGICRKGAPDPSSDSPLFSFFFSLIFLPFFFSPASVYRSKLHCQQHGAKRCTTEPEGDLYGGGCAERGRARGTDVASCALQLAALPWSPPAVGPSIVSGPWYAWSQHFLRTLRRCWVQAFLRPSVSSGGDRTRVWESWL